jgi:hypothetical protein
MVRLGIDTGAMVTALDLEDGLQLVDDTVRSEERKS